MANILVLQYLGFLLQACMVKKLEVNFQCQLVSDIEILHGHADYNQVVLDVNRSLKRFPPGKLQLYKNSNVLFMNNILKVKRNGNILMIII